MTRRTKKEEEAEEEREEAATQEEKPKVRVSWAEVEWNPWPAMTRQKGEIEADGTTSSLTKGGRRIEESDS